MKALRDSAVILFTGLLALVVWWLWPATPAPQRIPRVQIPSPPTTEMTEAPPVMPPPPERVESPLTPVAVTDEPPPAFDPQADLSTAISDYIALSERGDYLERELNYEAPNNGISDQDRVKIALMLEADAQLPESQQQIERDIEDLKIIQNIPPIMSDNGNTATYTLPAGRTVARVIFIKINGRWYMN